MPVGLVRGYTRHLTPVSPAAARTDPLDRALIGEWRFDQNTGLVLPDYSGYGNTGDLVDDAHFVTSRYGPAVNLDGTGDYVVLPASTVYDRLTTAITIEAFLNVVLAADYDRIVAKGHSTCWSLTVGSGQDFRFYIETAGGLAFAVSTASASRLGWHHVVGTYDNANILCYDNGVAGNPAARAGPASTDTALQIRFGILVAAIFNDIEADFALVRIYNRVLSAAEVRARYEICLKRAQPMTHVWMMPWAKAPPTGATYYQTCTGGLTFTGSITKKTSKGLVGTLTLAGGLVKKTSKGLSGALTFAGSLGTSAAFKQALSGALTFVGTLSTSLRMSQALSGAVSFVGDLATQYTAGPGGNWIRWIDHRLLKWRKKFE